MARRTGAGHRGRRGKDAKVELLSNVPLFSACSNRDLRRIAALEDMEHLVQSNTAEIRATAPGMTL